MRLRTRVPHEEWPGQVGQVEAGGIVPAIRILMGDLVLVQTRAVAGHRGDEIRSLYAQTCAHAAATRESRHVDAVGVGRQLADDISPDLTDELHVIGGPGSRGRIASRPSIWINLES